MRGSSKPCPGCGKVKSWRPAKEVCKDCKNLLARAEWMEEKMSELGDDEIIVVYGKRAHWNEYIFSHSGDGRKLMDIFQRVAMAASVPSSVMSPEFSLLGKTEGMGAVEYAKMTRLLAEAIRDLRIAIGEALKAEYQAGKKDGHSFVKRLASGDLSINEFDKKTS